MTDHKAKLASTGASNTFRAVLTPNRSLSERGFLIVMIAVGLVSFCVGVGFAWMGAWPVLGFFGLDVLLIYWAFKRNYRDGREAETIEVSPYNVVLTRIDPKGRETRLDLNTYWVRLALDERSDGRTHLNLLVRNETFPIADFLSDDERRQFADVLRDALTSARTQTGF